MTKSGLAIRTSWKQSDPSSCAVTVIGREGCVVICDGREGESVGGPGHFMDACRGEAHLRLRGKEMVEKPEAMDNGPSIRLGSNCDNWTDRHAVVSFSSDNTQTVSALNLVC